MRIFNANVKLKTLMVACALGAVSGVTLFAVGCVHRSGGTWMVKSAPLPEGWPELTPVGAPTLREYPVYRAAWVDNEAIEGEGTSSLFRALFGHISENDIAMTTPVEMGYTPDEGGGLAMSRMAFLYRTTDLGPEGVDGAVVIEDVPARTFISVGMRGEYTDDRFREGEALLDAWLDANPDYTRDGETRYLGYNGPFTLWFLKYGEVQAPVTERR